MGKKHLKNKAQPAPLTAKLELSREELMHLRDLMSVQIEDDVTVSVALADSMHALVAEERLWNEVANACLTLNIPVGDGAPDYVIHTTVSSMIVNAVDLVEDDEEDEEEDE